MNGQDIAGTASAVMNNDCTIQILNSNLNLQSSSSLAPFHSNATPIEGEESNMSSSSQASGTRSNANESVSSV